jgi:hypothetical protein
VRRLCMEQNSSTCPTTYSHAHCQGIPTPSSVQAAC